MKRLKNHDLVLQYLAIAFASMVFGACAASVVTTIWPNSADWIQTVAILITIIVTLLMI